MEGWHAGSCFASCTHGSSLLHVAHHAKAPIVNTLRFEFSYTNPNRASSLT